MTSEEEKATALNQALATCQYEFVRILDHYSLGQHEAITILSMLLSTLIVSNNHMAENADDVLTDEMTLNIMKTALDRARISYAEFEGPLQ